MPPLRGPHPAKENESYDVPRGPDIESRRRRFIVHEEFTNNK